LGVLLVSDDISGGKESRASCIVEEDEVSVNVLLQVSLKLPVFENLTIS
jgi:hypothetical protein